MTRIYAEDIAKARGISVQAARAHLRKLAEVSPHKVHQDGRRAYTTAAELAAGTHEERLDDLVERVGAVADEQVAAADAAAGMQRAIDALTRRVGELERRSA